MISRRTRAQLFAFVVLATTGIAFVGAKYAGLERLVRTTTYTVEVQLATSGGIFRNAEVTYRGVEVGRVGELRPTEKGVVVDLEIRKGTEDIPSQGLRAEVRNLSAVGELYVDLVPTSSSGPYLRDGSVIRTAQTATPVPPAELLASLNGLLDSLPKQSLRTVLGELDEGFSDTGPDLERLLDSTSTLVAEADGSLEQTTKLIEDGVTVLRTQNDRAGDIRAFGRDLRLLAGQLEDSDVDLRRLVRTGPAVADQATALLRESGPGLGQLTADLLTIGRLAEPRNAALRQLLVVYPALARAAYSAVPGDGTVHFGIALNVFNPLPCTSGYEATRKRSGTDLAETTVAPGIGCDLPQGDPSTVRGSQNVPRQPVPAEVAAPSGTRRVAAPAGTAGVSPELIAELRRIMERPRPLVDDPTQILESAGQGAR